MTESLYTCGHCSKTIAKEEEAHEMYADDSGEYHQECQDTYSDKEQAYWLARYKAEHHTTTEDETSAYEWGDPKNPAYVEWLLDNADAGRG
jgi:hypothetical protein